MLLVPDDEIKRKLFHFLTIIYIVAYWVFPRLFVLQGLGIFVGIVIIIEFIRLNFPQFNSWLLNVLGGVHRQEETNRISGLIWTISGSFLTMLIFDDKRIVMVSLLYLAFGDAFAALIGRWIGKTKFLKGKTLEGSITCLVVCLIIGFVFLDWRLALIGAFFATIIESIPWPLNDNFWMPLMSAMSLTFLNKIILP